MREDIHGQEHFAYDKSWEDIELLLEQAEQRQNWLWMKMQRCNKSERMPLMRNYKGLEGVINGLRWVLGDKNMSKNKVLGKD